jgi:hypothetical protein
MNQNPIKTEAPGEGAVQGLELYGKQEIITSAVSMASTLGNIIRQQRLVTNIKGKEYVNVEGWTTLAAMLGVIPREVATTEQDGIYTAIVELARIRDGAIIGRASAECGEEEPWASRPRYARRSMAQTRATGKACRLAFSWIMKLAGYEPTPAEEMPSEQEPESTEATISKEQHKALEAKIREFGLDRERVKAWVFKVWDIEHLQEIPAKKYGTLIRKLIEWKANEKEQEHASL